MKYLISACLVGEKVRYDGQHSLDPLLKHLINQQRAIMICPEVSGGLNTPRLPAEIVGGTAEDVLNGLAKVIDQSGQDQTQAFIKGAQNTLALAQQHQISYVILKANSPSCGSRYIYDGTFSGNKILGNGITTALLKQHGFQVLDEIQFLELYREHRLPE